MRGKTMLFGVMIMCAFAIMAQPSVSNAYTAWLPSNGMASIDFTSWNNTSSFYMYDWNNTDNNLLLFDAEDDFLDVVNVKFVINDDSWSAYNESTSESIDLGPTKEFGFYFFDGSVDTQYTVTPFLDGYILTNGEFPPIINGDSDDQMAVGIFNADPVPIPASALLLGSGMVGLIAFGQRMRKRVS